MTTNERFKQKIDVVKKRETIDEDDERAKKTHNKIGIA